jgi:VanZ family protein
MTLNIPLILIVGIISYFVVPFVLLICKRNKSIFTLVWILFAIFIVILLCGVLSQYAIVDWNYILHFDFSYHVEKSINWEFWNVGIIDMLINIFMLIPIGQVVAYFAKTESKANILVMLVLVGLGVGLTIETLQYLLPINRSVQLSDVILNSFSVVLGGVVVWFYEWIIIKLFKSKR